jgi:hypothetical protein
MNFKSTSPRDSEFANLTELDASRLLQLGLSGPRRPVDALIDRLSQLDGHRWLESALTVGPASVFEDPENALIHGRATLDQLKQMKDGGKSLMKQSRDRETRLIAIAGYFVAIAAAMAHYGNRICSREREELNPILLDLAAVAPNKWSELLSRAALAPDSPL